MREIKFRGKGGITDSWLIGSLVTWKDGAMIYGGFLNEGVVRPETIGQYTGLKDKNGKEIYEGDVVDWVFFYNGFGSNDGVIECDTIVRGIIKWQQGGFILEVLENDFEEAGFYSISALYTDTEADVEVVGNIHDDTELIKEEQK